MSTITLSATKINMMPLLIIDASNAVKSYKSELQTLKSKLLAIDSSVCNVDDVISSIKASTQTQKNKINALDNLKKDVNEFVADVVRIDGDAADAINQSKNDFYDKYEYLKPDCEKSWLEEKWDNACEWCKEHWKAAITIVIVIAAVILVATGVGGILGAMALGALFGTGIGGLSGGIISAATGGSFWEGFENGAFSGAIAGIISGGMGFGLSAGGKAALGLGKTMLIGAASGLGSSLIGDLGDILIKGEDISLGEVFFNAAFSGAFGAAFSGIGYGFSKGFTVLKTRFGGKVTPLENGPYIKNGKPNGRPGPSGKAKLEFEKAVYNKQVGKDGILRDPNTKQILNWKPGEQRTGKVDFGHKAGKNYSKMFEKYMNGKISLKQLKAFQSTPKNFRIEGYSPNRGHLYEKTIFEITKGFPWLSSGSNAWKEFKYAN